MMKLLILINLFLLFSSKLLILIKSNAGAYEFFLLQQQWPPAACRYKKCSKPAQRDFTVHGYWPQDDGAMDQPEFCFNLDRHIPDLTEYDIVGYRTTLHQIWPNYEGDDLSFWKYQWRKHGSCSYPKYGPRSYFKEVIKIYSEKQKLLEVLDDAKIYPSPTRGHKPVEFLAVISEKYNVVPRITCMGANPGELIGIGICVDKEGNWIDCTIINRDCDNGFKWLD